MCEFGLSSIIPQLKKKKLIEMCPGHPITNDYDDYPEMLRKSVDLQIRKLIWISPVKSLYKLLDASKTPFLIDWD